MHEMEEGVRSREGLVKKKNSSGCLIIKKKVDGSRKVFESNKERKRPRLAPSNSSGSSDDDDDDDSEELSKRKKTGSFQNGQNGGMESDRKARLDVFEFDDEYDYGHHRFKHTSRKWNDGDIETGSSRHIMIEKRKKSYFDSGSESLSGGRKRGSEYGFKSRLETDDDEAHLPISSFRQKVRARSDEPIRLQGKNGVLKVMVNKKKKMDVPSKLTDRQLVVGDRKGSKSEIVIKKDTSIEPSFYSDSKRTEKVVPVIRTEKSEVKGRKPVSKSAKGGDSETEDSDTSLRRGPSHVQASKGVRRTGGKTPSAEKMKPVKGKGVSKSAKGGDSETEDSDMSLRQGPSVQASKRLRRTDRETPPAEKMKTMKGKEVSKSGKGGDSETEDSDMSLRRGSSSVPASKGVRRTAGKAPSAGKRKPDKGKEVQTKRGSGTEKQLLREKIRHMLITAGWTIDYRPRRNRDYLDSVYIDPSGTGYWSIIKAYDALQKQQDVEEADVKQGGDSSQFMPLPDDLLSKLTRQTRKKREREMKMKRKNHGRTRRGKERKEGSAKGAEHNGKSPKGRSDETSNASGDDSGSNLSPKRERSGKQSTATNSRTIQGRKSRKIGRCTLLIRSSDKRADSESDGYVPYTGKRTVLSWLIDSGVVHLSERVQYMNRRRTRAMLEGWVTGDGIHCGCCSKILTVSKFEIHAGSKLRQPFQNIYLESGTSLSQCQIEAWNRQEESKRSGFHTVGTDGDDPDDDTCGLCGDGGDLICCDGCPSTFHQSCLDIQMLPPGDWHCPNCICKICGIAGDVSDVGDTATVGALLTCSLCVKKYHESCSQEMEPADVNRASASFCGKKCQELFDSLQKLLGVKHELEAGFSWSLIHRTEIDTDASHRGAPQRVECNSKLAVALSVMNECFLPIVDRRSSINLIHNILYNCGSNFSRLNYSGFYTVILERGDEIVSAAAIRIHGTQLAEMPFIGTRHMYRRQGMCRRLLTAIELALCSLKVEKLFIPAIAEHMNTWTMVFGFNPLEESHKKELRSMNMLVFPGTDMLQKPLVEQKTTGENTTANSEDLRREPDLTKKSDADSSGGHDLNIRDDDVIMQNGSEIDDKAAAEDFGLEGPAVLSDSNALLTSSTGVSCEPKVEVLSEENATLQSQSVEMSTESSADFVNGPPSSDLHHDLLKMENPVLDPSVNSISSLSLGKVLESNVKAAVVEPVLDPLEETSAMDTAEEFKGDKKLLSVSTVDEFDETTKESNSDLSPCISDHMEYKLHVASESEVKVDEPVEGNIESFVEGYKDGNHDAKVKVLDSLGGISAEEEKNNGILDLVSVSSSNGNDECSVQLASDMNQPDALHLPSKLIVASIVSNAEVAIVEGNGQSSAVSDIVDTLVLDSLDDSSTHNTTEEVNNKPHHVPLSNLCEKEESSNSGSKHQSKCEVESEIPVASEVCYEADIAPVRNDIRSSEVGDIDDKADDGKVACVEPDLDSCGEISAHENDITKDQEPASVSSLDVTAECTVHLNSASNKQNALDMESNLHAALEVALGGCNILSSAEDDMGKEAEEVNVINAPVEISMEHLTEEIKANVTVSTIHESDDSSVQFESDQNNQIANAMETDLS
ncbi:hypothetical protein RHSIM_Rhsim02G0024300 [Rhododendron simsii]|uniref:PHD-type domain-containing protein n=1 Tax=Rhododendron simsii TaxID=118357 RepID=A0A834HFX5_RHOSS|nr:hypothetical protein RHSIM_Rhsim02G0024300 [Rhododendron simsii]